MKKPEKLHMENKKASIIVLAAAALIFAAAVFLIYSASKNTSRRTWGAFWNSKRAPFLKSSART